MTLPVKTSAIRAFLVGSLTLTMAIPVAAGENSEAPVFDVKSDKDFADFRKPLASFLRSRHAKLPTTVCLLGEQHVDGTKSAWVIWPGGHTLLLWDGGASSMAASRRALDLSHDVVASDDEVAGSTYLVTRAWVAGQMERCRQFGTTVSLSKRHVFSAPEDEHGELR